MLCQICSDSRGKTCLLSTILAKAAHTLDQIENSHSVNFHSTLLRNYIHYKISYSRSIICYYGNLSLGLKMVFSYTIVIIIKFPSNTYTLVFMLRISSLFSQISNCLKIVLSIAMPILIHSLNN